MRRATFNSQEQVCVNRPLSLGLISDDVLLNFHLRHDVIKELVKAVVKVPVHNIRDFNYY